MKTSQIYISIVNITTFAIGIILVVLAQYFSLAWQVSIIGIAIACTAILSAIILILIDLINVYKTRD